MKSLGIYITEEEIDELIDAYDENGDCEFDLEEFRTMVLSKLHVLCVEETITCCSRFLPCMVMRTRY